MEELSRRSFPEERFEADLEELNLNVSHFVVYIERNHVTSRNLV